MENKWISVDEKLPEVETEVFVCDARKNKKWWPVRAKFIDFDGPIRRQFILYGYAPAPYLITHWFQCPPAPPSK